MEGKQKIKRERNKNQRNPRANLMKKAETKLKHFLSVFIIHIHIDRFLIQHGSDSVTVFQFDLFFFFSGCLFCTRITIKSNKDNTMYDSL